MEFSRQEAKAVEVAVAAADKEPVQLTDLQLLSVGGGVADVTFS